jgi:hypothetical protein
VSAPVLRSRPCVRCDCPLMLMPGDRRRACERCRESVTEAKRAKWRRHDLAKRARQAKAAPERGAVLVTCLDASACARLVLIRTGAHGVCRRCQWRRAQRRKRAEGRAA